MAELELYLGTPNPKECPIFFWTRNRPFLDLSKHALEILTVPATSCKLDKIFSQCSIFFIK